MAINSVLPPYPSFFDSTGAPLENGFVYIGQPGLEARTTPKASFFDIAQTIPSGTASGAAIRTRAGFAINQARAPAMIYVDGDYSMTVTDRNGVVLYTALNNTLALNVGGTSGPVLWGDGDLGVVGGGFSGESNTGFVRPSAGVMQTAVTGAVVTEASTLAFRTAVPFIRAIAVSVTAGTNAQGQGPLAQDFNVVTTAAANPSGVTLPTAVAGRRITITNRAANPINIYPATGAQIGALAVNLPVALPVGQVAEFFARTATQWEGPMAQPFSANLTQLAAPTYVRGDIATRGAVGLDRLALGATGLALVSDGTDAVWGRLGGEVSPVAASGTAVSFSSIPAAARRIVVMFDGVSLSGTDNLTLQIGTGGVAETTGYNNMVADVDASPVVSFVTTGFALIVGAGGNVFIGMVILEKEPGSNAWYAMSVGSNQATGVGLTSGRKLLGGVLDFFRVVTSGANTFDAGNISYRWTP